MHITVKSQKPFFNAVDVMKRFALSLISKA
jgi:hypothetical protein